MSRARTALWWLAGVLVLILVGAVVLALVLGPRFGLYVFPPSPTAYAAEAAATRTFVAVRARMGAGRVRT